MGPTTPSNPTSCRSKSTTRPMKSPPASPATRSPPMLFWQLSGRINAQSPACSAHTQPQPSRPVRTKGRPPSSAPRSAVKRAGSATTSGQSNGSPQAIRALPRASGSRLRQTNRPTGSAFATTGASPKRRSSSPNAQKLEPHSLCSHHSTSSSVSKPSHSIAGSHSTSTSPISSPRRT